MKKCDFKERWELTDEERKEIYEYAIKRSDEIKKGLNVAPKKEDPKDNR